MRHLAWLLLGTAFVADAGAVRGVPPSLDAAYAATPFKCLDTKLAIDAARVNDDYCDCADGTDEPGTSACANGRFYCVNKQYRGKYVPSSLVNDGVCDCCDGSDEYASRAGCQNTCEADGAAWREAHAAAIKKAEEGALLRKQYAAEGAKARAERNAKVAANTVALEKATAVRDAAEEAVRVAEEAERAEAALRNEASPLSDASLTHSLELGDANASELRSLLLELARRSNAGKTLAEIIRERRGVTASPTPVAIAAATTDDDSEGDAAAPADHAEARAPQEGPHWPDVAPEAVAEYHSAEGDAARAAVATARRDVEQLESEGRSLADDDRTDYGPGDVFFRLKGSCFETKQAQYTYSACPFGAAKQDSTSLGTFSGWGTKPAGPPAVAGALNATDYSVMKFTGGSGCWNGPSRSLTLAVECGASDVLSSVDEPEKCTYTAKFQTPAACDGSYAEGLRLELAQEDGDDHSHGEL